MARMGHSSTRAAMRYQHATQEQGAAIALGLNTLLAAAGKVLTTDSVEGTEGHGEQ